MEMYVYIYIYICVVYLGVLGRLSRLVRCKMRGPLGHLVVSAITVGALLAAGLHVGSDDVSGPAQANAAQGHPLPRNAWPYGIPLTAPLKAPVEATINNMRISSRC